METAITQLLEALKKDGYKIDDLDKHHFLEIEKEQMHHAFRDGMETYAGKPVETELDFEEYYNETFK